MNITELTDRDLSAILDELRAFQSSLAGALVLAIFNSRHSQTDWLDIPPLDAIKHRTDRDLVAAVAARAHSARAMLVFDEAEKLIDVERKRRTYTREQHA